MVWLGHFTILQFIKYVLRISLFQKTKQKQAMILMLNVLICYLHNWHSSEPNYLKDSIYFLEKQIFFFVHILEIMPDVAYSGMKLLRVIDFKLHKHMFQSLSIVYSYNEECSTFTVLYGGSMK